MSRHHPYETLILRLPLVPEDESGEKLNAAGMEGWRVTAAFPLGEGQIVFLERPIDRSGS